MDLASRSFQVSLASSHQRHVHLTPLGLLFKASRGMEHDPIHVLLWSSPRPSHALL